MNDDAARSQNDGIFVLQQAFLDMVNEGQSLSNPRCQTNLF
jgi:hypothetical protein